MLSFNTTLKLILLILLPFIFYEKVCSQHLVVENIKSINLRHQSAIKVADDIIGYFFIYEDDIVDDYSDTYKLSITDNILKLIKETIITVSEQTSIFEYSFNGSEIIILFFHQDDKTFEYQVYDLNGVKKFTYLKKLSGKELRQYKKIPLDGAENILFQNFHPVENVGFISNTISEDKNSISIDFYNSKENKQWNYIPKTGGNYFFGEYLGTNKNVVYLNVVSYKGSIYSDKAEVFLVGLDLQTGKEFFKKPADSKYKLLAKGLQIFNDGEGYLYGPFYKPTADIHKDKALGFAVWKINGDGSIMEEKYLSWANDFKNAISISNKGKIQGIGYIHFHNIVQAPNGDMYVLGEGYDKIINPFTVVNAALFGILSIIGDPLTITVATDILLIRLDSAFKLQNITVYNKNISNLFGYYGTQTNRKDSSISFIYLSKRADAINYINVNDGKISTEKIKANPKGSKTIVLPASTEQKLMIDYFKSLKRLELYKESFIKK